MSERPAGLDCSRCGRGRPFGPEPTGLCPCGAPLLARYRLTDARRTLRPREMAGREPSLWRYAEVLPDVPRVSLVAGSIADAGQAQREANGPPDGARRWFDLSTLREPFRVEGKKTMAYEIVEQLDFAVPDVIVYPAGGGTGLIGMWKAFGEMQALGWIGAQRPRMVAVQAAGCVPIVRAFAGGLDRAEPWSDPRTVASGLRVPSSLGDALMLEAIRASRGEALAVEDREMIDAVGRIGALEGIDACPEGGAALAALTRLAVEGRVERDETIVLFNTGTGLKYNT